MISQTAPIFVRFLTLCHTVWATFMIFRHLSTDIFDEDISLFKQRVIIEGNKLMILLKRFIDLQFEMAMRIGNDALFVVLFGWKMHSGSALDNCAN
jgi:hypothetical protein